MVTHTDFLWMHYDFLSSPPFWHFSSILTFGQTPQKWPILAPKKVNVRPAEKSHSPNPYWYGLFAKNRVQIGQIWLLWPHLYFTPAYRGSPPCTLFQHPDNREIGYSNVLGAPLTPGMSSYAIVSHPGTSWVIFDPSGLNNWGVYTTVHCNALWCTVVHFGGVG